MRSIVKRVLLACAALAAGCGPAVDQTKLAAVQVVGVNAPPLGCRLLGPLEAKDSDRWVPGGPRYETAMLDLRKKAVLGGGNYLVMDAIEPPRETDYTPTFVVRARLFACNVGGAAAASSPPAAGPLAAPAAAAPSPKPVSPACEPDCSPGYTCLRGACVSACNPLCSAGEKCGADRVCHPVAHLSPPAPVPP
jgi:hypothetical protein